MSTLDSFISSSTSRLPPECIATSQEIRDRGSTFVATIYPAASLKEARAAVAHVKHIVHRAKPASHEVAAWRCMVLRPGKTGLEGPDDFELQTGCQDDGEQHGGGKVLRVMQDEGILDAAVVVSRWYVLSVLWYRHLRAAPGTAVSCWDRSALRTSRPARVRFAASSG